MTATEAKLRRVAKLAGEIVLQTPKRGHWSTSAYVRRSLIQELEQALIDAGYDMQHARKLYEQAKAKRSTQG